MRFDSSPPIHFDDPSVRYDLPDVLTPTGKNTMSYVALKLNQKSLDQKLDFATSLGANLTTYVADFPLPPVTPGQLTSKVAGINAKKLEVGAAQTALDTKLTELDNLEVDLDTSLTLEGKFIDDKSGGVAAKILELGVEVQADRTPPSTPDVMRNVRLMVGDNPGEIKTTGRSDPNAKAYKHQISTDPTKPELWMLKYASPNPRHVLKALTSGQKIYHRMCGVGKKKTGDGPWSDIASITVP